MSRFHGKKNGVEANIDKPLLIYKTCTGTSGHYNGLGFEYGIKIWPTYCIWLAFLFIVTIFILFKSLA